MHFVGTSYAAAGNALRRAEPVAAEFGVEDLMREVTGRVAYLDALQLLLDASALVIVGTDEPHYTASKIYPYALARKPILAILHEQSSAVKALQAMTPARILTFSDGRRAEDQAEAAAVQLEALVSGDTVETDAEFATDDSQTARAMTRELGAIFDRAVEERNRAAGEGK
jgi:hypothetical protein